LIERDPWNRTRDEHVNTIEYTVDKDGIALLTMDVKVRPMNVITPKFVKDLAEAVAKVAADDAVKGAVIASGKDTFMAGADLVGLVESFDERGSAQEVYAWCRELQQALRKMETCGKPFAAAINATALGGGLEVCLACHYRVAASHPKSVLGLPEVQVGLLPGGGGTQRLPRLIGIEPALQLITQGNHVSPAEAQKAGFIDEVVSPGEEIAAAKAWILASGDAEQPWDKKGFKVPGGAGLMNPAAICARCRSISATSSRSVRSAKAWRLRPVSTRTSPPASCSTAGTCARFS
jgi:3-hydroxyacyl-CoA dehydrogenase/enoyl-CoA hydratase/3-hydroxybutyryl-CoA epimerase